LQNPPNALTGDLAISYLLTASNTKLRAHAGNSYRAPSLYERFGGGFNANPVTGVVIFTPYGDPRLSPDRYNSVDAGLDQYLFRSRVRLAATWFYNRVVSVTAFDSSGVIRPETDPYGRSLGYINGSGGISRGFELGIEARPTSKLVMNGSYTFTNAALDRDITVRDFWQVFQVPRHITSMVVTQQWTRRLDTTFDLFHYSSYFSSFFAVNRSRAFAFPGFTKSDLGGSLTLWDSDSRRLRLYGQVENLFHQRYCQNGWLAARASFRSGLALAF
jgi:iron complex outermembrane receptor protein